MYPIPNEIVEEVVRQQTAMGWPDTVPAWAMVPNAAGVDRYYRHQDLTVGLCEQVVEYHVRTAQSILAGGRWAISRGKIEDAARHILMARLYRCRYIQLVGKQDSTEDDMPFAHNQW